MTTSEVVYCCRKCREVLFAESALSPVKHENSVQFPGSPNTCTSFFLDEPEPYMKEEGKLCCPKCETRFGSFSWSGTQCSCGFWCVPAIQIPKSRVDPRTRRVQ
ncbi:hypothetical protein BASA81_008904 [Batrachochytrium salamandrivorans]|nr:hypothetical protein BASA81_008904 [Batrachochytrium salamandrivorans]